MADDLEPRDPNPDGTPASPPTVLNDPEGLKAAHDRTGRMLHKAGLPFDDDEFEDEDSTSEPSDDESDSSESSSGDHSETSTDAPAP